MKRYLIMTAAIAGLLMAASCQKEDFAAAEGDYAEVSFTADLPGSIATRATIADGQQVNKLHYEVYAAADQHGNLPTEGTVTPVLKGKVEVSEGKADFNVRLIKNKYYTVFFWAQYEKDNNGSPYYKFSETLGLREITVDYKTNNSSNDEFRDAFYAVAKGVKYAGATTETIELHRPFAQVNVATSDFAEVLRQGERPQKATLTVTGVSNSFDLFNGAAAVPAEEITASFTAAYIPGLDDSNKATYTVADVDDLTTGGNSYDYLSMAYVLVPGGKDDTSVSTLTATVTYSSDVTASISYEGATLQQNRRTNLIGQLLTTSADYEIIVDEEFFQPGYDYEYENVRTVKDANLAFASGSTSVKIEEVTEDAEIVLPSTTEETSVLLPETTETITFTYAEDATEEQMPEVLNITAPEGTDIVLDVANTTVYINGVLQTVTSTTAQHTLYVTKGTVIENLIVVKGNVRIEKGGVVKNISRADNNGDSSTTVHLGEGITASTDEEGKATVDFGNGVTFETSDQKIIFVPFTTPDAELSFAEQIAATAYGKVTLTKDEVLETPITIAAGHDVTIDLNGYTLSGKTSGATNPQENFIVKGTLTVKNGTVTTQHTGDNLGWNAMSTIFDVTAGGVLNIDNATIENLGGTDMAFCVHLNNWGEVTLNAANTTFRSPYVGIRAFNSGPDMNNLTLNNCDILTGNGCIWVHNYTIADFGNNEEKAAAAAKRLNFKFTNTSIARTNGSKSLIRFGFTGSIYYSDIEMTNVVAGTADALVWALENNKNVLFNNDLKIDPANMSNAYGTTGINVKNGQTIDGNGFTLDVKGAGGTWDSGINTTGGLIKNIKVTGSFRGIFINHNSTHSEPVVLENVTIDGTTYTISCDQGLNQTLKATGSTFNGWTSFAATLGEASFDGCNFGEGNGYAYCRPYAPATFKDCNFAEGFELDARATVTFENCKINGVALTADNLSTLVTSNIANASVK